VYLVDAFIGQDRAGAILDVAMAGTSATLLARKWESALLVNGDNDTLRKILANPQAVEAVMKIEGFRALGSDVFETVINKSEKVKDTKKQKGDDFTREEKKELSAEEKALPGVLCCLRASEAGCGQTFWSKRRKGGSRMTENRL
jgi:hypothetical protein